MSGLRLTPNAVSLIFNDQQIPGGQPPVVQIVDIKKVTSQKSTQERCRTVISDGDHLMQAMLAAQVTSQPGFDDLRYTVIRMLNYTCNTIQGRRFAVITDMEVMGQEQNTIGNPQSIDRSDPSLQGAFNQNQGGGGNKFNQNQGGGNQFNQNQGGGGNQFNQNRGGGGGGYNNNNNNNNQFNQNQTGGNRPNQFNQNQGGGNQFGQGGGNRFNNQNNSSSSSNVPVGNAIGPDAGTIGSMNIIPIRGLSQYINRWCIKARITNKSDMRTYAPKQPNGSGGKLFSIDLVDQDKSEIRATSFNEVADKFYGMLQIGQVYLISRGSIKMANPKFSSINNPFEITFDQNTTIMHVGNASDIPGTSYHFVKISNLVNCDNNTMIDVVGVLVSEGTVTKMTVQRTHQELAKRNIVIRDDSNAEVDVTIWGERAENFSLPKGTVIAIKGAKVSDFRGKSLSTVTSSLIDPNPQIEEAYHLAGWYNNEGIHMQSNNLSSGAGGGGGGSGRADERRTIAQIREHESDDNGLYSLLKATITYVKDQNFHYYACTNPDCKNKKIDGDPENGFQCHNCNGNEGRARYILSVSASDPTGNCWLSLFDQTGEHLFGMSCGDLLHLSRTNPAQFQAVQQEATFKTFNFKVRSKMEDYKGEKRLKYTVQNAEPVDYAKESERLLAEINKMQQN